MCVIVSENGTPSSTRLTQINVELAGKPYNLLLYTNDMTLTEKQSQSGYFSQLAGQFIPSFANSYLNSAETNDKSGSVMIVAVPYRPNRDIGLVDVNTEQMKQFRSEVKEFAQNLKPKTFSKHAERGLSFNSLSTNSVKKIHKIGNYQISVALSLSELQNNIDWNTFSKPADFDTRYATLQDQDLTPFRCAYVVAQAVENVENDGFGIIFPKIKLNNNNVVYFPTCHEKSNLNPDIKHYDVELVKFGKKRFELGKDFKKPTYWSDGNHIPKINSILKLLEKKCTLSESGEETVYKTKIDCNKVVSYSPIQTDDLNKNVILSNS